MVKNEARQGIKQWDSRSLVHDLDSQFQHWVGVTFITGPAPILLPSTIAYKFSTSFWDETERMRAKSLKNH